MIVVGVDVSRNDGAGEAERELVQVIRRPRCPRCESVNVAVYCTRGRVRHMRCRSCLDEKTGRSVTFKVVVE